MGLSSLRHRTATRLACVALLTAGASALLAAAGAQAATVTVGSPLSGSFTAVSYASNPSTWANTELPEPGANVTSPTDGAVIRWRTTGAFAGGPFSLRVLRPDGSGAYAGVAVSAPETPSGTATQTFATDLPIKAGDTIGIDAGGAGDLIGTDAVESPGTTLTLLVPQPEIGGAAVSPPTTFSPAGELGFNADVLPPPTVSAISPASGSAAGGTGITITGTNFAEVQSVGFGASQAQSFKVDSETQISAVAPAAAAAGAAAVTVTTLAGSATATQPFTYAPVPVPVTAHCVVPKLKGKRLKAARKKLAKADCKLGKVRRRGGVSARRGKVVKQSPKAGKVLAPGAKVNVKLGS